MAQPTSEKVDVFAEVRRVLELEGQAILKCSERLQAGPGARADVERALGFFRKTLEDGGKIIVTGIGKSGKIAQKIAATMCSTGSLAVFLHPAEGLHGDLGLVSPKDSVLALSYSGNAEELLNILPSFKSLHVPVVGIGGNRESRLAQACDVWIDGRVEQEACPHNLAPTSSTTLALALGDALAIALMRLRGFEASHFAANHPGGALGRRLNLTVADVMRPPGEIATVAAQAPMDEVVVAHTRKSLGAVLVVDGPKLVGIITDGDIRRALAHREKFFDMKASQVMVRQPVTVMPETMAAEALELMENRPSQIAVLPVVDQQGLWKGLVRLHDLIRSL